MENMFEVIKNYDHEDEEVLYSSSDYNKCVSVCNELHKKFKKAGEFCFVGVYASEEMWEGCGEQV